MKRHTLIAQITLGIFICLAAAQMSQAMFEAISELEQPTYTTVRLVSSDKKSFALPKEIAFLSDYVRTYLTGEFREVTGPTRIITRHWGEDLPRTVHVDIPGSELAILAQIMRLLHEHRADAKAQANAVARMPRVTPDNIGALIHDANLMLLPETCITGLIDRLAEFINQEKITEIPLDDRKMLTQLVRTYFLKYDEDLGLTDADGNPIDIGFSIQELLDAGRKLSVKWIEWRKEYECDLKKMRINSLEGLLDIPEINKCQRIRLNRNQISSIQPGTFRGLPNLVHLRLNDNQITSIQPGTFQGLSKLWELNLQNNRITSIQPGTFQGLSNLEELVLMNNQITSIQSGTFQGLQRLAGLWLNDNQITSIQPGTFQGLQNLGVLNLNDNQITSIQPGTFQGLQNLGVLGLEGNQISSIQPGTFAGLPLATLDLSDNRLSPDTIQQIREELPPGCKLEAAQREEWRERLAEAAMRRLAPPAA